MNVDCSLIDSRGRQHRVKAMVLWNRLCHFPRLVARLEGKVDTKSGPFTFHMQSATNDATAVKTLAQSRWHLHRCISQANTHQTLLELGADPSAHLQVQPFAKNAVSVEDLIEPLLHPTDVKLAALAEGPRIEAVVSCGETLEQLAFRLGGLTNSVYRVKPVGPDTWNMEWATSLSTLAKGLTACKGRELVSMEAPMESGFQRIGIPTNAAAELLHTGEGAFSDTEWQPLQLGWAGADAVSFGAPQSETGRSLSSLRSEWVYLTDLEQVPSLWRGDRVKSQADDQGANALASLFVYGSREASITASTAIEQALGGRLEHQDEQGWFCIALTVSPDCSPKSSKLVHRLVDESRFADCLSAAVHAIGLPQPTLEPATPAARYSNLPAVVVKNPLSPEMGPLSRTEDGLQYRTKIWVQILGVRGAVEVDWAIPFASHDNSATGGTLGGDQILVPAEFTYGYVSWVEAGRTGAPFFFATTHYRDVPVSAGIGMNGYTHGIVTNNGLLIHERSTHFDLVVRDTLTISSLNSFDRSGNGS